MKEIFDKVFKDLGYENNTKIVKSNKDADYQCDDLFLLAKKYSKSPMEIGLKVVEEINKIDNFSNYFKEVSFSNPGFINIKVSDYYICDSLRNLINKERFGIDQQNNTIVLDYGGPNVAKPLHVGHLRSAIIGQAVNNILKFAGNNTISDIHLGDFGTQMGQVIYGILNDFSGVKLEEIDFDINYLNKTYPKISALCKEDEEVKAKCLQITKDLQDGNKEYNILWKKICLISIEDIKKIYKYLSVNFDLWYGESDSYKEFPLLFEKLNDFIKIDDGAKIIDVKEDDDKVDIPPCLIEKTDGAYLYATSDLGTILQRERDFKPNNIIYITDNRQSMHFTQVFRVAKKASITKSILEHYGFGTVNGKDNKPFKTREGGTMKLQDLITEVKKEFINLRDENKNMDEEDIDKIVNAILKFADLSNDLSHSYIFDIKKFCEVNGKTGPYILYTYLRINRLINDNHGILSNTIYSDTDRALRLKLLDVNEVLSLAIKERKPHYIANYLYELCVLANNFYQNNRVIGLEGENKKDFEIVLSYNNYVIKTLLKLLGIGIPNAM